MTIARTYARAFLKRQHPEKSRAAGQTQNDLDEAMRAEFVKRVQTMHTRVISCERCEAEKLVHVKKARFCGRKCAMLWVGSQPGIQQQKSESLTGIPKPRSGNWGHK